MSQLFIAHGHRDVDPLLQVHEAMRRASIPTWYTPAGSKDFEPDSVKTAIDDAFGMVVLVSASSIRSKAVQEQLQIAHERGLTLFPIRTDNARLSKQFKTLLADQLTDSLADEGALERLVQQVKDRYERRCPVISVMNLKGGVGKTTVSSQVFGTWQASLGGRTLLIDLDPQYNLTQTFFDMEHADASSARDKSVISLFERSRLHAYDTISPSESWSEINTEPFEPAERQVISHDILAGENAPGGRFDLISGQFEISKYAFAKGPEALALVGSNFRRMIDYYRSEYDLIVHFHGNTAIVKESVEHSRLNAVLAVINVGGDTEALKAVTGLVKVVPGDVQFRVPLLKKSQLNQNKAVYELNDGQEHHGHLVCLVSGAVHEFHDPLIEDRLRSTAQALGFDLTGYALTAYGRPSSGG